MQTIAFQFNRVNNPVYIMIQWRNKTINPHMYCKIDSLKQAIDELSCLNLKELSNWKAEKKGSSDPVDFTLKKDHAKILKRASTIKLISSFCIVMMVLGVISSIAALILGLPSIAALGSSIAFLCSETNRAIESLFYKCVQQNRVIKSLNFRCFVENYLIKKMNFIPTEDHLTDAKLHSIYCNWKKKAKTIIKNHEEAFNELNKKCLELREGFRECAITGKTSNALPLPN
jgi:hypothetical protein